MGDYVERIIDVEVAAEEAGALAERTVDWLVAEGVLSREMSSYAMYSDVDAGYLPGPGWQRAVADASDPSWVPGPVAVLVGRDYHVGGQGMDESDRATCPRCGTDTVIIDYPESFDRDDALWRPFEEAIAGWRQSGAAPGVACAHCDASSPVTEWRFADGFDLGALAFDFWGWPPLAEDFKEELAGRLGHRVAVQLGKL